MEYLQAKKATKKAVIYVIRVTEKLFVILV